MSIQKISSPVLAVSPRLDETVTSMRPVLSWNNSKGGVGRRTYCLQIDITPDFNSSYLFEQHNIPEKHKISSWRLNVPLKDNCQYFWRVRAEDSQGNKSEWGKEIGGITARFKVDSSYTQDFFGVRVPAVEITASHGSGAERIQDYDEEGFTCWEGVGAKENCWVKFDLGYRAEISCIWLLCGPAGWFKQENEQHDHFSRDSGLEGRLVDYCWQYSDNGIDWHEVPNSQVLGSDAFRMDLVLKPEPVLARYFKIHITRWMGPFPKIYEATFYTRKQPDVPLGENDPYVLIIGTQCSDEKNQHTELRDAVLGLNGHMPLPWKLNVIEIPAYKISFEVLEKMCPKPVAIILTGSGRWGEMMPRFEYNGVFNIIRHSDIPILGVCNGHQLLAQQEELTFVRNIGRRYHAQSIESLFQEDIPPVYIQKYDPIFCGMTNPFFGAQYHSWSIDVMPAGFEVLATSKDSQGTECIEVIKAKDRLIYGTQFHPEKPYPWSLGKMILINFLRMALNEYNKKN
ncbi:MAG: glutamine amidotransferase-related protein [Bacillota bacterium]|jgi:anthranilate/para-aminobenzoate synthase component II|nr:C26 family cysteine hydrolase domain-containing family [Clostridia bacterium]